jgi:hypothetical protein
MFRMSRLGREPAAPAASPRSLPCVALVQLIATAALALSTLVAATAVSIGIARAEAPAAIVRLLGL